MKISSRKRKSLLENVRFVSPEHQVDAHLFDFCAFLRLPRSRVSLTVPDTAVGKSQMVSRSLLCVIGAASAALAVVPSSASSAPRSVARYAALCPCFFASFSGVGSCIVLRMLEVSTREQHLSFRLNDRLMGLRLFVRKPRRSLLQAGSWSV